MIMKEKIMNLLESISKDVQIRQESSFLDRSEFWCDTDYIPFGLLRQIESLSSRLQIGVIGFNNGFYYITVYGLSTKS